MDPISLNVQKREKTNKSAARSYRNSGLVPAVLYGNKLEPIHLLVSPTDFSKAIDNPFKRNSLLQVEVDGQSYLCLIKDVQVEPLSRKLLHLDFYRVEEGQEVDFQVPLFPTGKAIGVQKGGSMQQVTRKVKLHCAPQILPSEIVLDISELEVGEQLKTVDLPKVEGISYLHRDNEVMIQVTSSRDVAEDEEAEGEEAEAAEGEEAAGAEQEAAN